MMKKLISLMLVLIIFSCTIDMLPKKNLPVIDVKYNDNFVK